jgi:tight adherence protein B
MKVESADALESLSSLLRSGYSVPDALNVWPREAPPRMQAGIKRMAGRISLGDPPSRAIESSDVFGLDAGSVAAAFRISEVTGASLAVMLERTADSIRVRAEARRAAGAGSAGARLSARLVAGLPLAFVPFMPAAGSSLTDPTGSALLVLGVVLCVGGLRWISILIPPPPPEDPTAQLADRIATILRAGASLDDAMAWAMKDLSGPATAELRRAVARVRLGASWIESLLLSAEPIVEIGSVMKTSYSCGLPTADALERLARRRRAAAASDFETSLKRAPVMMVLPLTLCVLPSYALLGLAPFVRGVAIA